MRRQVSSELKLRRYVLNTVLVLSLIYVFGTLVFSDMGVLRYMEIKEKHAVLANDLNRIEAQNNSLKASINKYKSDPFYIEKHARENFGMSSSDEIVYIYKD